MRKLIDLNPELSGEITKGAITYDCPVCRDDKKHRVYTRISSEPFHEESFNPPQFFKNGTEDKAKIWQASGSYPDTLTLQPSINIVELDENGQVVRTRCWHGFITNGEVT